jgi:hypothetical protein
VQEKSVSKVIYEQIYFLVFFSFIIFFLSFFLIKHISPTYGVKGSIKLEKRGRTIESLDLLKEETGALIGNTVQKLKSNTLLNEALLRLNYNYPINSPEFIKLKEKMRIRSLSPGSVIEISFSHQYPEQAAELVNTMFQVLMDQNIMERETEVKGSKEYIILRLNEIREKKLKLLEENGEVIKTLGTSQIEEKRNKYLKELGNDLNYTNKKINGFYLSLHKYEVDEIKKILTPNNWLLKTKRSKFDELEQELVFGLMNGSWNTPQVKELMKKIWREKVNTVDIMKRVYGKQIPGPENIIGNIFVYYVKLYDLQIRQELLVKFTQDTPPVDLLREKQIAYESLLTLENRFINKLSELEGVGELPFTEISWVDQAVPPHEPCFPTKKSTIGLSLLAVLCFCFISVNIGLYKNGYFDDYDDEETEAKPV